MEPVTAQLVGRVEGLSQSFSLRVGPSTVAKSGAGLFVDGTISAGTAEMVSTSLLAAEGLIRW